MINEYIRNNKLITPIGNIYVSDEKNNSIEINIKENDYTPEYKISSKEDKVEILNIESNYVVEIMTKHLVKGQIYKIIFDGGILKLNTGDEHTISITGTYKGYSIGICAYDPNDDEIIEQSIIYSKEIGVYKQNIIEQPQKFDESRFQKYKVNLLDDMSGFKFKLLDYSLDVIKFYVAWIKNNNNQIDEMDYEDAIDFWIS